MLHIHFHFDITPSEGKGCKLREALEKATMFVFFFEKCRIKTLISTILQIINFQVKIKYNIWGKLNT